MSYSIGLVVLALFQATERPATQAAPSMTTGGWIFMISAWAFILVLTFWTFSKILRPKK